MLCYSLGSRLRGNDGGRRGNDGLCSPSPWDPVVISPWEGEGDGSREGDLTACFAFFWVPACAGMTGGRRGGMDPLRRCAPRPPFASLRCAKRGGVVVSLASGDPIVGLGGVLRG